MRSPRAEPAGRRGLSPRDALVVSGFCLLIPPVWALLRLAGFGRVDRAIDRLPSLPVASRRARAEARAPLLAHLAGIASRRRLVPSTCLARSVALRLVLHLRGVPTKVHLGVRSSETAVLDAHAWLELHGVPLDDSADVATRYAPLHRPRPRPRP